MVDAVTFKRAATVVNASLSHIDLEPKWLRNILKSSIIAWKCPKYEDDADVVFAVSVVCIGRLYLSFVIDVWICRVNLSLPRTYVSVV